MALARGASSPALPASTIAAPVGSSAPRCSMWLAKRRRATVTGKRSGEDPVQRTCQHVRMAIGSASDRTGTCRARGSARGDHGLDARTRDNRALEAAPARHKLRTACGPRGSRGYGPRARGGTEGLRIGAGHGVSRSMTRSFSPSHSHHSQRLSNGSPVLAVGLPAERATCRHLHLGARCRARAAHHRVAELSSPAAAGRRQPLDRDRRTRLARDANEDEQRRARRHLRLRPSVARPTRTFTTPPVSLAATAAAPPPAPPGCIVGAAFRRAREIAGPAARRSLLDQRLDVLRHPPAALETLQRQRQLVTPLRRDGTERTPSATSAGISSALRTAVPHALELASLPTRALSTSRRAPRRLAIRIPVRAARAASGYCSTDAAQPSDRSASHRRRWVSSIAASLLIMSAGVRSSHLDRGPVRRTPGRVQRLRR